MAALEWVEKEVAAALKASVDVSAICAGKVFPLKIPQGTKLPAVIYQRIHSSPDNTLAGYTSEGVTMMVNSYAMTYEQAKELARAVRKGMAAAPLGAIFTSDHDFFENDADVFCVSAEFICQQYGGFCQ